MRGSDQGQSSKKRQCLTCKNKGCVGHCRFAKAKGVSDQATALPRLYRSPVDPCTRSSGREMPGFAFPPNSTDGLSGVPRRRLHASNSTMCRCEWLSTPD